MDPGSGEILLKLTEIRDIVASIKAELSEAVLSLAALGERQARLEQRLQDGGSPTTQSSAGLSSPPWPRWRLVRLRPATQPGSSAAPLWVQGGGSSTPAGGPGRHCLRSLVHSQQGLGARGAVGSSSPPAPRRLGPCVAEYIAWTGGEARPFPHVCDQCAVDKTMAPGGGGESEAEMEQHAVVTDGGPEAEEAAGASPCSSRSSLDASVLTPVAYAGTTTATATHTPMRKWSLPSLLGGVDREEGGGGVGGRQTAWRRSLQVHSCAEAPSLGARSSGGGGGGSLPRLSGRAATPVAHARPGRRRNGPTAAAGDAETRRSQAAGRRVRRGKDREGPGSPVAPAAPREAPARKGSLRESLRSFFSRSRVPNATTTEFRVERKNK